MTTYSIPIYRLALKRERTLRLSETALPDASAVLRVARRELGDSPHERLLGFFVNAQNTIIGMMVLGSSSAGSTIAGVSARGICQAALTCNANGVILAHNHPSGDPTPSRDDEQTTRNVAAALKTIDIALLDHVIVTRSSRYCSRCEEPDIWRASLG